MEISQQVNSGNTKKCLYGLKISIFIVHNENIHDLLTKNNAISLQISKLVDNETGKHFTRINDLSDVSLKNFNDYKTTLNQALQNRKILENNMKITDLKKKSNLIISFTLSKKEVSSESSRVTFEKSQNISQLDFAELTSTDYGLDINMVDQHDYFATTTVDNFRSLSTNLECIALNKNPKFDSNLTLALKKTLNVSSQILFINCVHSNEDPPTESYNSLKVY